MTSYLVFPNLVAAQNRSKQQAVANGCDGVATAYWWEVIQHPSNGQAALAIEASGLFGPSGLTAQEITSLQTQAELTTAGWFI